MISVTNLTAPYNGTNFTLTSLIELSDSIDTDVTISGVWSPSSYSQVSETPPYLTNFQPLATNSSGNYTLTVTIQPTDDSDFIMPSNTSTTYHLVVMRK